ncbi:hypothetical protein CPPEL_10120 [Corynebacterium pseudopelargi]|uniref:Uncharacterized protein n=1 Tax=Corynebacterium pseudopelargi TaxID=2080757 RepID=A0A3G6IX31_9CORY|nr:hypothetical protein CPPEL_10120 [Corynebacterium pseudopelargi]
MQRKNVHFNRENVDVIVDRISHANADREVRTPTNFVKGTDSWVL